MGHKDTKSQRIKSKKKNIFNLGAFEPWWQKNENKTQTRINTVFLLYISVFSVTSVAKL